MKRTKDDYPTGYLGKAWKDMTKEEVLEAYKRLWDQKEDMQESLTDFELNAFIEKP